MNKFLKFMPVALMATVAMTFTACSDDDDDDNGGNNGTPTVDNVMPEGLPSAIGNATFTTNAKGQVTSIVTRDEYGTETITFEYGQFTPSRASHNYTVLMTDEDAKYYMEVNAQGFVTFAHQVYNDVEDGTDDWWFEYSKDGQLTSLRRTESGDKFKITYTNGDITKVVQDEEDGDHRESTIKYTNDTYKTAVANKGGIMFFDEFFNVDMDEMGVAYFAGLLGKPTKNLPMGYEETGKEGSSTYTDTETYNWEFNADNLPIKFWQANEPYEVLTFAWK